MCGPHKSVCFCRKGGRFAAPTTNISACCCCCCLAPGPKERLDDTSIAQPCLFVANLAALEVLRGTDPAVVEG